MKDERRKNGGLTIEQVEQVKAAILASIYEEIGRSVVSKLLWTIGTVALALLAYFGVTGRITFK